MRIPKKVSPFFGGKSPNDGRRHLLQEPWRVKKAVATRFNLQLQGSTLGPKSYTVTFKGGYIRLYRGYIGIRVGVSQNSHGFINPKPYMVVCILFSILPPLTPFRCPDLGTETAKVCFAGSATVGSNARFQDFEHLEVCPMTRTLILRCDDCYRCCYC